MKKYNFNVEKITSDLILYLRRYFYEGTGKNCKAVIGISGGKDSSVLAKLLVEAIGKERVYGVLMPNGEQNDIAVAKEVVEYLGIQSWEINIADVVHGFKKLIVPLKICNNGLSNQSAINLPARTRMVMLYLFAQQWGNCRVINTCNLSEKVVGYSTRWGDDVGDISPLSGLTVTEVKLIGHYLKMPYHIVEKVPSDGLCDKTDEDSLGFPYAVLDRFIREGFNKRKSTVQEWEWFEKICDKNRKNQFKIEPIPHYIPKDLKNYFFETRKPRLFKIGKRDI